MADGCRDLRGAGADVSGERARGSEQEHVARGDRQAERPGPVDHGDGDDAVPTGDEEVGVGIRVHAGKRLTEDPDQRGQRIVTDGHGPIEGGRGLAEGRRGAAEGGDRSVEGRRRSAVHERGGEVVPCAAGRVRSGVGQSRAFGQGRAVQLAVHRQGKGVHAQHPAGHHVRGQLRRQGRREVVGHLPHHVGHQMVAAGRHGDGHVHDAVQLPDRRLHLTQLDAEALELHLVVGPPDELQLAVDRPPGQVTRVVHTGPVTRERVGHEAASRELRPAQIAQRHLVARDVDAAHPARRHRTEPVVEQVRGQAGDRAADRADVPGGEVVAGQHPVGDVHGGLGDAVHVDQLRRGGAVPLDPAAQPSQVERLATEDDPAQRRDGLAGVPVGLGELVESGRGLVQHGHPALADQPVEVERGAGQCVLRQQQLTAVRECAPQLPHREVEREGVELHPDVVRTEPHVGLGPGEQRHHAGVRHDDALGPAGRSGGVDHVCRVVPVDFDLGLGGV